LDQYTEFINVKKVISLSLRMHAVAVFVGAFLILVVVTLAIPGLPPGELVCEVLGFPQVTGSFLGISVSTLLNGFVNGFLGGLVAGAVYALSRRGSRKPLLPLPVAEKLPSPPPKAIPVDERVEKIPPAMTVREGRFRRFRMDRDRDVKMIEGIGSLRGRLLNGMGVRTVDDLLRVGATSVGRQRIARRLGVSYSMVLSWVHRGDLLRVKGVGRQYSELLESAGVSSVADLSNRNAFVLWKTLRDVNREKRLVRRVPPRETIEMWVYNAKKLDPIIK
jgi:predicted flap endonuclease-1-like 5' DNA nuclease